MKEYPKGTQQSPVIRALIRAERIANSESEAELIRLGFLILSDIEISASDRYSAQKALDIEAIIGQAIHDIVSFDK